MTAPRILFATLCCLLAVATSAGASTGWYLMAPPILDGRVADERPLRTWKQIEAFESLGACKEMLAQRHYNLLRKQDIAVPGSRRLDFAMAAAGLCIASDDPRLGSH